MTHLNVGIVGLGMGRNHIAAFNRHPRAKVVALADVSNEALTTVGDTHSIAGRYASLTEMLAAEKLDIVSIATPNAFHKPLSIEAMHAGCHVLCEKPMAMNAEEAQEMLDVAAATGKRLMINFSSRFNDGTMALKEEIERGTLGDIYHGTTMWLRRDNMPGFGGWFGQKKLSGGGPLIDLGVHRLDLALWLMGYPKPVSILASTANHLGLARAAKKKQAFDVEDFAAAFIRFENGASLILQASWASHIADAQYYRTRLLGTKGGLLEGNENGEYNRNAWIFTTSRGKQIDRAPVARRKHPASSMEHLVDCIIKGKPHMASGDEGMVVMQMLDAIYESANSGQPVTIS